MLGIDYGEKRMGVAVSDPNGLIAQGLETIEASDPEKALDTIEDLIREYDIQAVVVGLPVNMDGTESDMAKTVQAFAEKIEDRTGCDVITWDERLTSAAAERALTEMGRSTKGRKSEIDRIAATIILQGYLDYIRHTGNTSDAG
jgi:putative Holliday junction resolvase